MLNFTVEAKSLLVERLSFSFLTAAFSFLLITLSIDLAEADSPADTLIAGEEAYAKKNYILADKLFSEAIKSDPDNYKALRSHAEVKIKLEKYNEAIDLLDRILALPATTGRNIIVYLSGDPKPREAEMVDENVMALDNTANDEEPSIPVNKFLKEAPREKEPHYRVFFKDTGKMKLLVKRKTRIAYKGIPTATRDETNFFKTDVQKLALAVGGHKADDELVMVLAGCFLMGSKNGGLNELPIHEVCISTFKIGKYEVNQKNFQAVMGFNPSALVSADHPVEAVTWLDARAYCVKRGLRLPTEAEWEFAARGGTNTEYYWGDAFNGKTGNFCDSLCVLNNRDPAVTDGFKNAAPVGSFPPNPYGLHDMTGNLSEWVQDWMDIDTNYYMVSPKQDPKGPRPDLDACMGVSCSGSFSVTQKVFRSGSWNKQADTMRSAYRGDTHFQLRLEGIGFRCATNADTVMKN